MWCVIFFCDGERLESDLGKDVAAICIHPSVARLLGEASRQVLRPALKTGRMRRSSICLCRCRHNCMACYRRCTCHIITVGHCRQATRSNACGGDDVDGGDGGGGGVADLAPDAASRLHRSRSVNIEDGADADRCCRVWLAVQAFVSAMRGCGCA